MQTATHQEGSASRRVGQHAPDHRAVWKHHKRTVTKEKYINFRRGSHRFTVKTNFNVVTRQKSLVRNIAQQVRDATSVHGLGLIFKGTNAGVQKPF